MAYFKTHYDSLNVSRNAPLSVIKAAYKALCQCYHPDKYAGGHDEAVRIMKEINRAYAVLSDPHKRADHDLWIIQQEKQQASYEAQRIMQVFTNTYGVPAVVEARNPTFSLLSRFKKRLTDVCFIGKKLARSYGKNLTKTNRIAAFLVIIGLLLAVNKYYITDLKIAPVQNTLTAQDVSQILILAQHLVIQGQSQKALPLYLQLAEQGNAVAQFQAGLLYANGQGIAKDDKRAADWFGQAARQGLKEAQTKLGFMYATGKGVAQNFNAAVYWCYKAAEQGDSIAQYNLGQMYAKGQGAAKDNSLALAWYSKAAAQGHAQAQYILGLIYENGLGVAKDKKQAVDFYRKAANQGWAEAEIALKKMESER